MGLAFEEREETGSPGGKVGAEFVEDPFGIHP